MKRIVLWLLSTVSAVVLLFGYHTSTTGVGAPLSAPSSIVSGSSAAPSSGTGSSSSTATRSAKPLASGPATRSAKPSTMAVTGAVAQTRWGPVQVRLTTRGRSITKVDVVQYPDGNGRDQEINAQALPVLIKETMQQQSAQIDMVSGATVTSDGYVQSLQSALDQIAS